MDPLIEGEAAGPGRKTAPAHGDGLPGAEQIVGGEHAEEGNEEGAEQEEERLVGDDVDDERADGRARGHADDEQALRDGGQEVLDRDGRRVDVGEGLVGLVHREREQRHRAAGPARGDRREDPRRVGEPTREREQCAEPEEEDEGDEIPERRPPERRPPAAREARVVGREREP